MILDAVAPRRNIPHNVRVLRRSMTNDEEARFGIVHIEQIEKAWRDLGIRPVVKGESDRSREPGLVAW
jgi:hypothetical protein